MTDSAAEDRRSAAAARQAKILARSQERLAKITGAAKGEGRIVSDSVGGIPPRPVTDNPPAPTSLADVNTDDDPEEVDLAALSGGRAGGAAGTGPWGGVPPGRGAGAGAGAGAGGGGGGGDDMFSQMLAQMTAQASGGGGAAAAAAPGGGGASLFGGAGLGAAAGGANPFLQPPVSPFPPAPKSFLDRIFPLVHLVAMVGLAAYAVVWLEPNRRLGLYRWGGGQGGIEWAAWGALAARKPRELGSVGEAVVGGSLAEVPLLWLFVSVELVLQTTRVFLVRNRPSPPSILSSLLPLLSQFSPQLGLAIQTGVRYIDLFSTCLNDLAVLIFCIGVVVLVGQWKTGAGQEGWVETAVEKGGEVLAKVTREL
ncbi:hypothetical protein JCM21900_001091 [Sporobolomyces salmonicolor]